MACGTDCTNCPTCRREVPHGSPAMHDLAWGMMQVRRDSDRVWGVFAVAEAVRSGVRSRTGTGPASDQIVLAEIERGVSAVIASSAALVLASEEGNVGPLFSASSPWGESREDREERQSGRKGLPVVEHDWPPGKKPPRQVIADKRCCVDEFLYPSLWYQWESEHKIGIHFEAIAKFRETNPGVSGSAPVDGEPPPPPPDGESPGGVVVVQRCACECCEFEQLWSSTLIRATEADPSKGTEASYGPYKSTDGAIHDCLWYDEDNPNDVEHSDGAPVYTADGNPVILRFHGATEPLPGAEAGEPPPLGIKWICPGRREDAWANKYDKNNTWVYTECGFTECDEPSIHKASLKQSRFKWKATWWGRIVDTCNARAIIRQDEFSLTVTAGGVSVTQQIPGKDKEIPPIMPPQTRGPDEEKGGCQ